jgi:nucleophosmin 1
MIGGASIQVLSCFTGDLSKWEVPKVSYVETIEEGSQWTQAVILNNDDDDFNVGVDDDDNDDENDSEDEESENEDEEEDIDIVVKSDDDAEDTDE